MTRSRIVITDRRAVLDAEDTIQAMISRLTSREPVRAEGMAIAERILTNAERSPLYNPSEPGSLRRAITHATAALDPQPPKVARASNRGVTPQPSATRRAGELRPTRPTRPNTTPRRSSTPARQPARPR
jgi:hypothetical protein